jgi:hypothetical protein
MRHQKNSERDGIFILVNNGVPNTNITEYGEQITNSSLCLDSTNQELYILKNNVWVKYGTGFSPNAYIPLAGTIFNKPVTGNIEYHPGVANYSGNARLTYYSDIITIDSTNNRLYIADNIIYSTKNNFVLDNNSKNNFITSLFSDNITISNSSNNKLFMSFKDGVFDILNSNDNIISGSFDGGSLVFDNNIRTDFKGIYNGVSDIFSVSNNTATSISLIVESGTNSTVSHNTDSYIYGSISDSTIELLNNSYIYGYVDSSTIEESSTLRFFSDISGSSISHSSNDNFSGSKIINVEMSNITDNFFGVSTMSGCNIHHVDNSVFLGKITSITASTLESNTIVNSSNYILITSLHNHISTSTGVVGQSYIRGEYNFFHGISDISLTGFTAYNIVFFTNNIKFRDGYTENNIILSNGFDGTVGSNNFLIHTNTSNNIFGDYNLFFGDIIIPSDIDLKNKNIVLGNHTLNDTISSSNILLGAKNLSSINHNSQNENVIINVDNFLVDDSQTVYLPNKINLVNNSFKAKIDAVNITQNNTYLLPNNSGTLALLSDITGGSTDVLGTVLTGYVTSPTNTQLTSSNTVLNAFGSLQKQINDIPVISGLDYAAISGLAFNNSLKEGYFYELSFATKDIIEGTNNISYTGYTETLLMLAINNNMFAPQVYSKMYPNDIIYFDFFNNIYKSRDGLIVYDRTGYIYYRKDLIRNIEVDGYDYRNHIIRRYSVDKTVLASTYAWAGLTLYSVDNFVFIADIVYRCSTTHTSTTVFADDLKTYWTPVLNLSETHILTSSDEYIWFGSLTLTPDTSNYKDGFTIQQTMNLNSGNPITADYIISLSDLSNNYYTQNYNISIKSFKEYPNPSSPFTKLDNTMISPYTEKYYSSTKPNIVIWTSPNFGNASFGDDCYNITIYNSSGKDNVFKNTQNFVVVDNLIITKNEFYDISSSQLYKNIEFTNNNINSMLCSCITFFGKVNNNRFYDIYTTGCCSLSFGNTLNSNNIVSVKNLRIYGECNGNDISKVYNPYLNTCSNNTLRFFGTNTPSGASSFYFVLNTSDGNQIYVEPTIPLLGFSYNYIYTDANGNYSKNSYSDQILNSTFDNHIEGSYNISIDGGYRNQILGSGNITLSSSSINEISYSGNITLTNSKSNELDYCGTLGAITLTDSDMNIMSNSNANTLTSTIGTKLYSTNACDIIATNSAFTNSSYITTTSSLNISDSVFMDCNGITFNSPADNCNFTGVTNITFTLSAGTLRSVTFTAFYGGTHTITNPSINDKTFSIIYGTSTYGVTTTNGTTLSLFDLISFY